LTVVLGVLTSYLAHALIETAYLDWAVERGVVVTWYRHLWFGSCALHPAIQYGLLLLGVIGGFLLGRIWWRWVYVEHRHWRHWKKRP